MATLTEERALLVARANAARAGNARVGFCPVDTSQATTGAAGPFYMWREKTMPTTTWTNVR